MDSESDSDFDSGSTHFSSSISVTTGASDSDESLYQFIVDETSEPYRSVSPSEENLPDDQVCSVSST